MKAGMVLLLPVGALYHPYSPRDRCSVMHQIPEAAAVPRVAAAEHLLDRGWGKPDQKMFVERRNVTELSDVRRRSIRRSLTEVVSALRG